ncbi:MAG: PorT family protein [Prevotella sp.]|nr:PorT family protein [Prevotella sp.]
MKKLLYLAALLLMPWTASAQDNGSKITLTPRVGMTVAGYSYAHNPDEYDPKVNITFGADAEYRISRLFGLSAGAYYYAAGAKGNIEALGSYMRQHPGEYISPDNLQELRINQYYVSIPIMLQAHVWKGLTLKAGLQWDHLVTARFKVKMRANDNGNVLHLRKSFPIKDLFHDDTATVPVGISYSYKNLELDARYLFGITSLGSSRALYPDNDMRNEAFMLTLGCNFRL